MIENLSGKEALLILALMREEDVVNTLNSKLDSYEPYKALSNTYNEIKTLRTKYCVETDCVEYKPYKKFAGLCENCAYYSSCKSKDNTATAEACLAYQYDLPDCTDLCHDYIPFEEDTDDGSDDKFEREREAKYGF